ncbi:unnamed protein product [Closterium sp. Naga37s-1]|nr:unnamed protein product [Closterium sp. Naga37s-1]
MGAGALGGSVAEASAEDGSSGGRSAEDERPLIAPSERKGGAWAEGEAQRTSARMENGWDDSLRKGGSQEELRHEEGAAAGEVRGDGDREGAERLRGGGALNSADANGCAEAGRPGSAGGGGGEVGGGNAAELGGGDAGRGGGEAEELIRAENDKAEEERGEGYDRSGNGIWVDEEKALRDEKAAESAGDPSADGGAKGNASGDESESSRRTADGERSFVWLLNVPLEAEDDVEEDVEILRPPDSEGEAEKLAHQFKQEVDLLARLDHPNVVRFIGACQRPPTWCILTEYLGGGSLRGFLQKREGQLLPLQEVVRLALDIARGMAYLHAEVSGKGGGRSGRKGGKADFGEAGLARVCGRTKGAPITLAPTHPGNFKTTSTSTHSRSPHPTPLLSPSPLPNPPIQGVVHRDLKPDNLVLTTDTIVKITDFGVARLEADTSLMTAETGTYRWMAPEVVDHRPYTKNVDVYSFGIVLWELCTVQLPFAGMTAMQAAFAVVNRGTRPDIPPSIPLPLAELMQVCWHSNPDRRPPFTYVVQQLEAMQDALSRDPNALPGQASSHHRASGSSSASAGASRSPRSSSSSSSLFCCC